MPTWRGMEFLPRVLDALASQEIDLPWDFTAIDSGSSSVNASGDDNGSQRAMRVADGCHSSRDGWPAPVCEWRSQRGLSVR